jgi:hypothetical protein
MKTLKSLAVLIFSILSFSIVAQDFPLETYKSSKVTYLGLDYTHTRFIDDIAFMNADELVNKYMKLWNHMLVSEPEKYNFKKFTDKSSAIIDLKMMKERNAKIDPSTIVQNDFFDLKLNEIPQIVRTMDFGDLDGLAIFYIVGTYNKNTAVASYFFVIFDVNQDEILFTKKYTTEPGGFGLKNYWARTYYNVLTMLEKDYKKKWSKGKN